MPPEPTWEAMAKVGRHRGAMSSALGPREKDGLDGVLGDPDRVGNGPRGSAVPCDTRLFGGQVGRTQVTGPAARPRR